MAHRAVLTKHKNFLSPHLENAGFEDGGNTELKVPGESPEDIAIMLSYLYTGSLPMPKNTQPTIEAHITYYVIAKRFGIEEMANNAVNCCGGAGWDVEAIYWSHFVQLRDVGLRQSKMWSRLMDLLCTEILYDARGDSWRPKPKSVLGGVLEGGMESDPAAAIELLRQISDRLKAVSSPSIWKITTPPIQPMKTNSWDNVDSDPGEVPIDGETHQDCNVGTHPNDSNAGARSCWDTDGTEPKSNWSITEPQPGWNTNNGHQLGLDINAGLHASYSNCNVVASTDDVGPPSSDWPLPHKVIRRSEQLRLPNIDYDYPEQVERAKKQLYEAMGRLILQPETLRGAPSTTPSSSEVASIDQGGRPGPDDQRRKWLPPWVAACDPDPPGLASTSSARFPASTTVMNSQNRELRQAQDLSDGWN